MNEQLIATIVSDIEDHMNYRRHISNKYTEVNAVTIQEDTVILLVKDGSQIVIKVGAEPAV